MDACTNAVACSCFFSRVSPAAIVRRLIFRLEPVLSDNEHCTWIEFMRSIRKSISKLVLQAQLVISEIHKTYTLATCFQDGAIPVQNSLQGFVASFAVVVSPYNRNTDHLAVP
eukprot:gnl/TRDRNA2_/TRDRNA2_171742_c0_seq3.p1 gnl/TRDRNA2_/TRDRNA2_171742_c0~~gnl/TRDRNA2_/TRDRNA2_171742_c0_seq3.p1  ORF type:complete len:113 (-),score=8.27 gnl/TRDRNA2_/TRDRNA2_171742_c0_seq3:216-554(-)